MAGTKFSLLMHFGQKQPFLLAGRVVYRQGCASVVVGRVLYRGGR